MDCLSFPTSTMVAFFPTHTHRQEKKQKKKNTLAAFFVILYSMIFASVVLGLLE